MGSQTTNEQQQFQEKKTGIMEGKRSDQNAAVITALDSLQTYAVQMEKKKVEKTVEDIEKEEMIIREHIKKAKCLTIQEQIAETIRLAKEKDAKKLKLEQEEKRD